MAKKQQSRTTMWCEILKKNDNNMRYFIELKANDTTTELEQQVLKILNYHNRRICTDESVIKIVQKIVADIKTWRNIYRDISLPRFELIYPSPECEDYELICGDFINMKFKKINN